MGFFIPLIIVVGILIYLVSCYNGIVTKKNRVHNAESQIDVQLKRRFDLIPNLVETVKGYAGHESNTLTAVINARNQFNSANTTEEKLQANKEVNTALKQLYVVSEAYPELKANTNFTKLQDELVSLEDKIGFSRQFYNDTVMLYNNSIGTFPNSILAGMFNFKALAYFTAEDTEKVVPKVSF